MVRHLKLTVNIGHHTLQWQRLNLQGMTNVGLILSTAFHIGGAGYVRQTTMAGNDKISVDYLQGSRHQAAIQETLRLGLRCSGRWQTREGTEFLQFAHHYTRKIWVSPSVAYSVFCLLKCNTCTLTESVSIYKMCGAKRQNTSRHSHTCTIPII